MLSYRIFLSFTAVALLSLPSLARSDDLTDLITTFENGIVAVNARNLETLMAGQHEQVVVLNPASPTPIDGKAARKQGYQQLFEATESFTVTPQEPSYRVLGSTGLVWGTYQIERTPKGGQPTTSQVRFSRTYVKSNGQWLLAAYHLSPAPSRQ